MILSRNLVGTLTFPKLKFWKIHLSLPKWLWSLLINFGRDKDQLFDVLVRVFPVSPETDLVKLKKNFSGRINYYYTQKKKIIKTQAEKEKFFDSESSLGELFSKTDNLGRESLSPAAGLCSSYRKETPLREQIRLLKEELACKDEQLSHYQKKAAAWKGVTIKNKNAVARSHAAGEESSISCSDLKKYEGGSIFEGLHNGGKFSFAKFNSSRLNSEVSSRHLDNHVSFAFIILLLLSGYSFSQVIEGNYKMCEVEILIKHMVKKKKDVFKVGAELAGFVFLKPFTVVEAVNLKSLLRLPMAAFRQMRAIFSNLGYVKLFPSETKIRELLNTSVSYLREAELSVKETLLQSSGTEKKMVSVPVLRAENLLAYIEAVFCKFCEKHSFYVDNNDEPVCIVFGGDKGGTSTKFHFSIVAPGITASAYNVKIFAMYEATDTRDNIRKVLDPFFGTIKNMQQPEFCLKGHKVKVLLNGDFKNLGLLLGHQGPGATYPSIKDEVEKS